MIEPLVIAAAAISAVVLTAKAWGHLGGDQVTAEFKNPGANNAPLSVAVTGNDIVVNLATDGTGALTSTAAQVVAAINASPAAAALVSATTYRGNAGLGVVPPRAKVNLDDFLNAPANVARGPFQQRVYRIGSVRDGSKVGVFLYCQQHAREWTTSLTCVETAERLVRNYATDPETKKLMDNIEVFILPNVNPDGGHYSMYDFNSQRRNMTNHCPVTGNSDPAGRNSWGVDLNRNNGEYSLFDGYFGASASCTSDTYSGPAEYSEPEIKNERWVVDTFPNIKFANNIHSYGGYFMWAPGSYIGAGRVTAPAPNIGIEKYFFEAGEKILARIKEHRNTVILPERTGPIADVLYSAAGNSADDQWYRKGIISYSFETGADRFTSTSTRHRADHHRLPALLLGRGHRRRHRHLQREPDQRGSRPGDGVRQRQLRHGRVRVRLRDGHDRAEHLDRVLRGPDERRPDQLPVQLGRRGRGHLLHDRRHDADPRRRASTTTSGPAASARC